MQNQVKDLQKEYAAKRAFLSERFNQQPLPPKTDLVGRVTFLKNMLKTLVYYKQLLDEEVKTVVTYLYKLPDAPICLYAL